MGHFEKTFESPFEYCPLCGGKIEYDEIRNGPACMGCGTMAFKIVKRFIRFYQLLNLEEYGQYDRGGSTGTPDNHSKRG